MSVNNYGAGFYRIFYKSIDGTKYFYTGAVNMRWSTSVYSAMTYDGKYTTRSVRNALELYVGHSLEYEEDIFE